MRRPLVAVALAALSCGAPAAPTELRLAWRFADGRRCADTGASAVVLFADGKPAGAPGGYPCTDGEGDRSVLVEGLATDARELVLEARTPAGTPLYRGAVPLGQPMPGLLTATLYFSGGR